MVNRAASRLNWSTFSPLFWVLAALYLVHWVVRWLAIPTPFWVQHYLDDLLCLPLVLTATLFVMRIFYVAQLRFSIYHVAFTVLYFIVAFEVFFPKFMLRYTGDFLDGILYTAGGSIFYRFLNK